MEAHISFKTNHCEEFFSCSNSVPGADIILMSSSHREMACVTLNTTTQEFKISKVILGRASPELKIVCVAIKPNPLPINLYTDST